MKLTNHLIVFDAPDLDAESAFWAAIFGGTVEKDDDWHTVRVDGLSKVAVQLAPNLVPPDWPGDTIPQQIHMDLHVEDIQKAHQEVTALGARLIMRAEDATPDADFQVYADPAGHPFCLCYVPEDLGRVDHP